jgi:hypothetical protein
MKLVIPMLLATGLLAGGCLGGSAPPPDQRSTLEHGPSKGTITGRVFTRACGGPVVVSTCDPTPYRGVLVFCRTMNEIGLCPSVRVDANSGFRITLLPGRWALLPAPQSGNSVGVKPRWVTVELGKTTTLNIRGGSQLA